MAAAATVVAVAISAQGQSVCVVALARAAAAALGLKVPDRWGIETAQDQGLRWLVVLSLQEAAIVAMLVRLPCLWPHPLMHLTTPALQSRPSYPLSPLVVFWTLTLLVAFSLELTQVQPLRA